MSGPMTVPEAREVLRMVAEQSSIEPDPDCEAALAEGLNAETLLSPRGTMQWIACRGADLRAAGAGPSEALERAWDEAEAAAREANQGDLVAGRRRRFRMPEGEGGGGNPGNPGPERSNPGNPDNPTSDGGRDIQTGLGAQPGDIEFTAGEAADFVRDLVDETGGRPIKAFLEGRESSLRGDQKVKLQEAVDVVGAQRVASLADVTIERDEDGRESAFTGQQTLSQAFTSSLEEFAGEEEPPNPTERAVEAVPEGPTTFFPAFEKSSAGYTTAPAVAEVPPDARCGNCAHFILGGGCHVVRGPIDPDAVCERFYADVGLFGDDELGATGPRVSAVLERGGLSDWSDAETEAFADRAAERIRRARDERGGR